MKPGARFRPVQHLRRPADFQRVYKLRQVSRQRGLTVFAARNDLPITRIGLSVSRQHGPAVRRNRWKRLLREAFRLQQSRLPSGLDLILIPERNSEPCLAELAVSLEQATRILARRLNKPRGESSSRGIVADSSPAFPPAPRAPASKDAAGDEGGSE